MENLGLTELIEVFVVMPFLLLGFAFWIWMLVDCATKESRGGNDKIVWILIIVFAHIVGAAIYYFVRRRPRRFAESRAHSS